MIERSVEAAAFLETINRGKPGVDLDAASRHLVIWGRRPDSRGRVHSHPAQPQLARLQAILAGY